MIITLQQSQYVINDVMAQIIAMCHLVGMVMHSTGMGLALGQLSGR